MVMKLILHMAITANGIIATDSGSEDFFNDHTWEVFKSKVDEVGCIIWGHSTYNQVVNWPAEYLKLIDSATKIIISSDKNTKLDPRFILASSPEDAISILEGRGFSSAILTGGSTLNTEFAKRKLINEIYLTVDEVIIGKGIQIFKPDNFELSLKLLDFNSPSAGLVQLHYKVI